ncbi:hypothetical protein NM688_g7566 [Phlebia brevispora]|uniref:Uncharacterized protein n=1 Tax=Phlebia brevispora TaxID=194682 RepID=A0ACC1S3Q8_9APHY|nr:hypothetical protein NM688_g7566 [Phlebia brevispora]
MNHATANSFLSGMQLEYPPSPTLSPMPLTRRGKLASVPRPELRVITQPGCYVFPLRTALAVTSPGSEYPPGSAHPTPTSDSTTPSSGALNTPLPHESVFTASTVPTAQIHSMYISQTSSSPAAVQPMVLPKLLPNSFFRFTEPSDTVVSSSQAVSIPPATELEVETYCASKALQSSTSTHTRAHMRSKAKPLTPNSSSEDLSSSDSSSSSLLGRAVSHPLRANLRQTRRIAAEAPPDVEPHAGKALIHAGRAGQHESSASEENLHG